MNQAICAWSFGQKVLWVVVGGIAIIVTSSRLQETLRVEPCVELELNLIESDLEPSLLILHPKTEKKWIFSKNWTYMIWLSTV